jgi:hypothetical protein
MALLSARAIAGVARRVLLVRANRPNRRLTSPFYAALRTAKATYFPQRQAAGAPAGQITPDTLFSSAG